MAANSDSRADLRGLMEELVKESPNLVKVRAQARRLGLSGRGDLVEIMAEVLRKAESARVKPRKIEVES